MITFGQECYQVNRIFLGGKDFVGYFTDEEVAEEISEEQYSEHDMVSGEVIKTTVRVTIFEIREEWDGKTIGDKVQNIFSKLTDKEIRVLNKHYSKNL